MRTRILCFGMVLAVIRPLAAVETPEEQIEIDTLSSPRLELKIGTGAAWYKLSDYRAVKTAIHNGSNYVAPALPMLAGSISYLKGRHAFGIAGDWSQGVLWDWTGNGSRATERLETWSVDAAYRFRILEKGPLSLGAGAELGVGWARLDYEGITSTVIMSTGEVISDPTVAYGPNVAPLAGASVVGRWIVWRNVALDWDLNYRYERIEKLDQSDGTIKINGVRQKNPYYNPWPAYGAVNIDANGNATFAPIPLDLGGFRTALYLSAGF